MSFKIPFSLGSLDLQKKSVKNLKFYFGRKKESQLQIYLTNADVNISREEYLAICYKSFVYSFVILFILSGFVFYFAGLGNFIYLSLGFSIVFSGFILFSRLVYPKVYSTRKERDIEKNLIPALQDMLVQLNAGVPLFSLLVNISSSGYGELSMEFKKAVKKINAGMPQIEVIETTGDRNSSLYFKRTLWQISNGLRAGSDISIVIEDSIRSLNEEQIIQIQNYGNKLNPLIMFYMLITVILPSLAITFLTLIASMVNLPQMITVLMFMSMFVFVVIIQIMFLGVIKSVRPSLL
jgi:pilus assembly protein TadC